MSPISSSSSLLPLMMQAKILSHLSSCTSSAANISSARASRASVIVTSSSRVLIPSPIPSSSSARTSPSLECGSSETARPSSASSSFSFGSPSAGTSTATPSSVSSTASFLASRILALHSYSVSSSVPSSKSSRSSVSSSAVACSLDNYSGCKMRYKHMKLHKGF